MTPARRQQIETRWQEIDAKLETVRLTGKSPIEGVDAEFYRGQLLEELDEMEFELGRADIVSYNSKKFYPNWLFPLFYSD